MELKSKSTKISMDDISNLSVLLDLEMSIDDFLRSRFQFLDLYNYLHLETMMDLFLLTISVI